MSDGPLPAAAEAPSGWYVYGVVPGDVTSAADGIPGIGSAAVELIRSGGLAALATVLRDDAFGAEGFRRNLEDPAWLEQTARAHEDVLEAALATSAVVPFRLGTVYEAQDHVRSFLADRGPALANILRDLEGKIELGVKGYFDPGRYLESLDRGQAGSPGGPGSGRAYLERLRDEQALAEEAQAFQASCATESHERLRAVASDARLNRLQDAALSGRADQMILNGAYLVRREDTALTAVVRELGERYGSRGVTYEVTGPWPPYNFVPTELVEA